MFSHFMATGKNEPTRIRRTLSFGCLLHGGCGRSVPKATSLRLTERLRRSDAPDNLHGFSVRNKVKYKETLNE